MNLENPEKICEGTWKPSKFHKEKPAVSIYLVFGVGFFLLLFFISALLYRYMTLFPVCFDSVGNRSSLHI